MSGIIKKKLYLALILFVVGLFLAPKANAASLSSASDTISTSRPSASAPLASDQAANATQVTVTDLPATLNNSALWLASDSAVLFNDVGQSLSTVTVASMSASNTPASNQRIVYFTSTVANTHHKGTAMATPITAMHTIKFTTSSNIPSGGQIVLTFPGSGNTTASPSATTFAFNGLTTANMSTYIQCFPTSACAGSGTISAPAITLVTNASISGGTTIYVLIGCTAQSSGACTSASPRLVNPTKGATAVGTGDQWKITIQTTDTVANGGTVLDSSRVVASTIEAVQVQGTVEPYITFTIAGVANNTTISTNNAGCTGNTDVTNPGPGLDATATFVNLGSIGSAGFNISAQNLAVTTNGGGGYTITATSSGRFINPATGFWFPDANTGNGLTAVDTPNPAVVAAGTTSFGIHPCGADTYTGITWGTGTTGGTARYSNPWNTGVNSYYATLASYSGLPPSTRTTTVEYEATAATSVPAGIYTTVFTYVATPIF